MEDPRSDLSLDEGRYVRLPLKALYILFLVWGGFVWGYFDLSKRTEDNQKVTVQMKSTVDEDHRTLMLMHDDLLKINDFADESKRMYNRYFRDFNDPDRKN